MCTATLHSHLFKNQLDMKNNQDLTSIPTKLMFVWALGTKFAQTDPLVYMKEIKQLSGTFNTTSKEHFLVLTKSTKLNFK